MFKVVAIAFATMVLNCTGQANEYKQCMSTLSLGADFENTDISIKYKTKKKEENPETKGVRIVDAEINLFSGKYTKDLTFTAPLYKCKLRDDEKHTLKLKLKTGIESKFEKVMFATVGEQTNRNFIYFFQCHRGCRVNEWVSPAYDRCYYGKYREEDKSACVECPDGTWDIGCSQKCNCKNNDVCRKTDGKCPNGCRTIRYYDSSCTKKCDAGYVREAGECVKKCHCRDNGMCDVKDGKCVDGKCDDGWYGEKCDKKCQFGPSCSNTNPCHCRYNATCDPHTGICPYGCELRWRGPGCQTYCDPGTYGRRENQRCIKICRCAKNEYCNATNGNCSIGGCAYKYRGKHCQIECSRKDLINRIEGCQPECHCENNTLCSDGHCLNTKCHNRWYGKENKCDKTCPDNLYRKKDSEICSEKCNCPAPWQCHILTGECIENGCVNKTGYYGTNCTLKCNCKYPEHCDYRDGHCGSEGCVSPRYSGDNCQEYCAGSTYMIGNTCQGYCHCRNQSNCDVRDGACVGDNNGCSPGWLGRTCQIRCNDYFFGIDCKFTCNCKNDDLCNFASGICPNGCKLNYEGPSCQKRKRNTYLIMGLGIWSGVMFIIVLVGVTMTALVSRKRKRQAEETAKVLEHLRETGHNVTLIPRKSMAVGTSQQGTASRKSVAISKADLDQLAGASFKSVKGRASIKQNPLEIEHARGISKKSK